MTEEFISIGTVVSTHGLKGRLKVVSDGSILHENGVGLQIRFLPEITAPTYTVSSVSRQKTIIVTLKEVESIEDADTFIGSKIFIQKNQVPILPLGEYYNFQIQGLRPVQSGNPIPGYSIVSVLENPAHTILEFSNGETTILIPFIDKYIGTVSIESGEIEVKEWQAWFDAL